MAFLQELQAGATVFTQLRFGALVVFSIVLPCVIYGLLLAKRSVSPLVVLFFGLLLVFIAGVDVYLLQTLAADARGTLSRADNALFTSEVSAALYLLPALVGGVGVNVTSHVLIRHLFGAERRFEHAQEEDDNRR
ncbi:hypothetical protein [Pulveribacter suum]|uniref:Uncharacterized protein n=1 Tax=Pulveribacter suum TaxID=2116657 RepID=A0A2P1NMK6_9BURK|nr:hypothetical protein [Pulveribacter suum]AVP58281.1 hypothetical protein C7H73_11825 [Pulveribacter suum]